MLRAWLVLDDCKYARSLLETRCVDKQWRYQWFATLALLRSVGYVLQKIDTQASARHKNVIKSEYKRLQSTKPVPEIFWEFIKKERDLVVHDYLFADWLGGASACTAFSYYDTGKIETITFDQPVGNIDVYSRSFLHGHFKGRTKLDVVDEAIAWWTTYLRGLDTQISATGQMFIKPRALEPAIQKFVEGLKNAVQDSFGEAKKGKK